ncbi:hypothetical protein QOZ80_4BG0349200 [Eleusine coracana subsp. coracana]|nr:hypothetical protein QOZ80_4BG0349200 [Eleusine coracana subsp. coracana]
MPVQEQEAAFDIEQEYNNTLRVRSNARFLSKTQRCEEEMEALLLTRQQELIIHPVLPNWRSSSEIELAMAGYFEASVEASEMCVELLRNIRSTQSNYQSMDCFLASMSDDTTTASTSSDAPVALNHFCTARSNFRRMHDKYSSVFQNIRSSQRKVAKKLKIVKAFKKLMKACLAVAPGAATAAHLMFLSLTVGPAAARLCPIALSKRMTMRTKKTRSSKTGSLLRLHDQLDAAARGTYVLGKDLDTVSQLVARLSDGMERENAMAMRCVEMTSMGNCSVMEMVSELKRSLLSSRSLAEELEEHVCLCLATIHRARVLVIKEITKSII